nr:MAG TPA: hypothetical protein [Caudoviricetes sp.]
MFLYNCFTPSGISSVSPFLISWPVPFSFLSSTFMAAPPSFPKFRLHFTTFIPVCLAVCDCFHKYGQMRQFCHHLTVSTANRIGHLYQRSAPAPMFLVVPVLGRFFRSLCCLKWTYSVRIAPTTSTSLTFVKPVFPINRPLSFPLPPYMVYSATYKARYARSFKV